MYFMNRETAATALIIFILTVLWFGVMSTAPAGQYRAGATNIDTTWAEMYYMFIFHPRHRRKECTVRIDVTDDNPDSYNNLFLHDNFLFHLVKLKPRPVLFWFESIPGGHPHGYFVTLFDQCSRRIEILGSVVREIMEDNPGIRITIRRANSIGNSESLNKPGIWIDDVNYDSEYWQLRNDATENCNAHAWYRVAQYHANDKEALTANSMAFMYYTLAEQILQDKNLQKLAIMKKNKLFNSVPKKNRIHASKLVELYLSQNTCPRH